MEKLSYGVTAIVGNYFVGKLRVSNEMFQLIEKYMKSNAIQYSIIFRNVKVSKKDVMQEYVHFSYIMHYHNLNRIKVMVRERRIRLIQEEIHNLQ
jgi:hypothetical protein